ncbi:MAG: branched-chain-amino-acid transaminase [Dehalococcoidia bacterium]
MVEQLSCADLGIEPELVLPIPEAPFPYLWFSGRVLPWEQPVVHVTTAGWPSIQAVFEGIRGYWNEEQGTLSIFRLPEHLDRFAASMKLMRMQPEITTSELTDAFVDLCRANAPAGDVYLQPLAFLAGVRGGSGPVDSLTPEITITMRPNPSALLSGKSLRACFSSWVRISDDALPPRIKALPNYANSRLAANEARLGGYDVPIFLNRQGKVAESSGSCVFMVRNGAVVTPQATDSILESVTRATLLELVERELGLPVRERPIDRTELYVADEVFLCGTSMEVTPVTEIDGFTIGSGTMGTVTVRIERLYHDVVRGIDTRYIHWLTRT